VIRYLIPNPVGAAITLVLQSTAAVIQVVRSLTSAPIPATPNDAGLVQVYAGAPDPGTTSLLDIDALADGAAYTYHLWEDGVLADSKSVTPGATYTDESNDALTVVRDRLRAGLLDARDRLGILANHASALEVHTVSPRKDDTKFPVVTLKLSRDSITERGLGEYAGEVGGDEIQGGLTDVAIQGRGWCQNADDRIELRKVLRQIMVANLDIFALSGLSEVSWSFSDSEDYETYGAPIYIVEMSITCKGYAGVRMVGTGVPVATTQISIQP